MTVSRIAHVLARRALFLTIALILIMLLTAVIIGATGYDLKILKAIVETELQAYRQQLIAQQVTGVNLTKLLEERRKLLEEIYGINKPWTERVLPLAIRALVLDLGYVNSEEVANIVGEQLPLSVKDAILIVLPRTIIMLTIAQIICTVIALRLAPLIAYKRGSLLDRAAIGYAAVMNALPVWWLGIVFIFLFGYYLRLAPTSYRAVIKYINSFYEDPVAAMTGIIEYSWLPILTVVIAILGSWLYSVRAIAIRVVSEDYVTVAYAKGLPDKLIVRRYVLRVIAGPVVTIVALSLAGSIGGFIITESVFDWPGMGSLYWAAISTGDAPTILGLVYITTLVYIVARFILEVLYVALDPRVRY
jgi:peptide/nickel transport system permease protein